MRLGLGNPPRKRRAMDAVTLGREVDPHRADRVVRTGSDRKGLPRVDPLEMIVGIVAVDWISTDLGHLQGTGGRWFLSASNRRGVKADQGIRLVEQLDGLPALVDLDPVGLDGDRRLSGARIDDNDLVSGAIKMLGRVQG